MKLYLSNIFPKIKRFSERLDDITLLTNQHWVSIDEITTTKTVYIFRTTSELLIARNGIIEKARWEYIGNESLLIDTTTKSYLFRHGFFDKNILALKLDSSDEYAVFVNETKYDGELNSIEMLNNFLQEKYLNFTSNPTKKLASNIIVDDIQNTQTVYRKITDNVSLKIVSTDYKTIGAKVFIDDVLVKDGTYIYKDLTHKLIVRNGKISEHFYLKKVNNYIFEKAKDSEPVIGDKVYSLDWKLAPNGNYKYSIFKKYIVENGKIVK